jgi:hypothetical protein
VPPRNGQRLEPTYSFDAKRRAALCAPTAPACVDYVNQSKEFKYAFLVSHSAPVPLRLRSYPRRTLRRARYLCAFVCDACETRKRAAYDPKIFAAATYPADEPIDD